MSSSASAASSATATAATPPPPPPPPALASPGPCGVSEPIRGTVEASNTGDLLKATLVLPTREHNVSSTTTAGSLPFSLAPLFGSGAATPAADAAATAGSFGLPLFGSGATLAALASDAAATRCSPPYPLVAFFSGFQSRASSYERYARHLASWGYAVVRYDARFLSITPDSKELGWLSDVVAWALRVAPAGTLSSSSISPPSPSPDLLFTAGHSRGAKLAALQYAGSLEFARCGGASGSGGSEAPNDSYFLPRQSLKISSSFLIDPIDNTRFTPPSEAYPSAAAALRAQGDEASLGIAAAGKIGACNPLESGFNHFWPAVLGGGSDPPSPSSFLIVFKGAGHATFNDAGSLGNRLGDWLCGSGDLGREAAMSDAGAAMVSWFDSVVAAAKVKKAQLANNGENGSEGRGHVSVSLESGSSIEGEGEGRVRVLIEQRSASPAPAGAAVPSPSAAFLQEDFRNWARRAAAAGQVEYEVRGGTQPAPQPAPCAKGGAAAKNHVVPFRLASSLLKEEEKAPVAAP